MSDPRKYPARQTEALLRELGYDFEDVQTKGRGGRSYDFRGCLDYIAWHKDHGFLGIQATDNTNHSTRAKKCRAADIRTLLEAGMKIEVWSWKEIHHKPPSGHTWDLVEPVRYELRRERILLEELET